MNRVERTALNLKNCIIDSDRNYLINKKRFEKLREKTNKINKFFVSLKYKENIEQRIDNKNNNKIKDIKKENEKNKISNLMKDNLLLFRKRNEIDSFYIHKNKKQILNENKKIRFMNKLQEYLETLKIKNNKSLDNKEKIVKLKNTKYIKNYEKRINKENIQKRKKLMEQYKKENDISLKNIKETNLTLNTINNNKAFLDEEIQLKYEHKYNSLKPKIINKSINESNINNSYINDSFIKNNFHIFRINKLESKINNLSYIKKLNKSTSYKSYSNYIGLFKKKNISNLKLTNNDSYKENEDENNKSKIACIYDEVKENNILNEQNREYIEDYFKKKKFILNKKPFQLMTIYNNTLCNISSYNVEKKSKKLYGLYFPENIRKYFDSLEYIDHKANKIKNKFIHSMCKFKINAHK